MWPLRDFQSDKPPMPAELLRKLVIFRYFKGSFMWAAMIVASAKEAEKFRLEVDICDNSGRNMRIVARALCSPADERKSCFEIKERYISLLPKQLECFIKNGNLCYKLRIVSSST
ncbi:uncharacterized protein LOC109546340 isoform X2 [Dendroctonus ponderosae]|uniref:uncharacterized protein LOC109546340 isoform X2 n=1 Tax=Dendroctonus ponderosae TaxID=77166 RepID=UPI0020360856|nr:uncharacterized protein LOC109546340 isoform X2 [Dendroctonus ponderosae]